MPVPYSSKLHFSAFFPNPPEKCVLQAAIKDLFQAAKELFFSVGNLLLKYLKLKISEIEDFCQGTCMWGLINYRYIKLYKIL